MDFTRYVYTTGRDAVIYLVDWGTEPDVQDWDEMVTAAGFDPEDEEVGCGLLLESWNGHPAGAVIISGLTVTGHPFAVSTTAP